MPYEPVGRDMNERIHKVLDGELSRDALTPAERTLLVSYEAALATAERTVQRHVAPDLTAGVMARIAALEASRVALASAVSPSGTDRPAFAGRLSRAFDWLWTPRPVALRPAWALGAAVLAIALFAALPEANAPTQPGAATSALAPTEIYVHFRLDAPDASSVHLAGDFTSWEPSYELHESQPGVWTVVVPLQAGVHDYAFVIDGERWTPDPLATRVDDGFGGENSRLSLLPPERMRV